MTIKSRLDGLERQLNLATIALRKSKRLPLQLLIVNDPEEGLEEFRLDDFDATQTIEIGSSQPVAYPEKDDP